MSLLQIVVAVLLAFIGMVLLAPIYIKSLAVAANEDATEHMVTE